MEEKTFRLWLIAITAAGFLLRVLFLSSQPVSVDDYLSGVSARHFVEDGQPGPTMWNHPVLRNVLIYGSLRAFGGGVAGLKLWSLLFGTLSIPLMAWVARHLVKSPGAALLAAFLWALDPVAINYSRQAINDIYLAFFPLAGLWLALRYRENQNPLVLASAGACFGLGLASKWSAVLQLGPMAGLLLLEAVRNRDEEGRPRALERFYLLVATLIVLPSAIYLSTYWSWFGRGYSLGEWLGFQRAMLVETSTHTGYSADRTSPGRIGDHRAWEWFLKPVNHNDIFFVAAGEGVAAQEPTVEENMVILVSYGNPLVWLLVLPGVGYVIVQGWRRRDANLGLLAALFLCSYLPLVLAGRPIWVNTAVYVIPYGIMAVGWLISSVVPAAPLARRRMLAGYVLAVTVMTVPLYIGVIGKGLTTPVIGEFLKSRFFTNASARFPETGHPGQGAGNR